MNGNRYAPYLLTFVLLIGLLIFWQGLTTQPKFNPAAHTEEELMLMEFNGDIVRNEAGNYVLNPDKKTGFPGPLQAYHKVVEELKDPFHKKGANYHGVGHLVFYTVKRFLTGFVLASVVAILIGVIVGLSKPIFVALNPFIQFLKPISPVAWMPLLLYSVKDPFLTTTLVVFMASLFPTIANTAFGVNSMRKDYLQVASLLEIGYFRRLFTVVLPAAAPAIIAGLRISFGSALVAVVPAEMLTGELGIGYLIWMHWNNLDISGVIFAILLVGVVGFLLDAAFSALARMVSYPEL